ncbi:hypothetical protein MMC20_006562 [Loxospora ochrophaea]|nr:hypothetical protein [Loxospora ochrophaea]
MTVEKLSANHYEVLGLPRPSSSSTGLATAQEIKVSYRRALLQHHPDKAKAALSSEFTTPKFTIDEIALAYRTLSNPQTRSEYDLSLSIQTSKAREPEDSYTGLEIVDLDDLVYDEERNSWYKGCRCGNEKGFLVTSEQLEVEAQNGEIVTGCRDCSLWLKVVFEEAKDN